MKSAVRSCARVLLAAGLTLGATGTVLAATATEGDTIAIQDMTLTVPEGWHLQQDAKDDGTIILGFEKADQYVTIFVKQASGLDMRALFANGSTVVHDVRESPRNRFTWKLLETSKRASARSQTYYVASFLTEIDGYSYYGYGRGASSAAALDAVDQFLAEMR